MKKNSNSLMNIEEYNSVAKFLHWAIGLLIICNYIGGLMLDVPEFKYTNLHKQFGMTILLLVVLRILWRIFSKYPDMAVELSATEKFFARLGHYALYVLMLAIPVLGVILVESAGHQLSLWGIIPVPEFISPKAHSVSHQIKEIHGFLAHTIIILAALHAVFALKHHFISKDSVLLRMIPRFNKK